MLIAHGAQLTGSLGDDLCKVARLARDNAWGVGARQQQEIGDQTAHPLRGAQRRARSVALLAAQRLGQ